MLLNGYESKIMTIKFHIETCILIDLMKFKMLYSLLIMGIAIYAVST